MGDPNVILRLGCKTDCGRHLGPWFSHSFVHKMLYICKRLCARTTWQGNEDFQPTNVRELDPATWNEAGLLPTSHQAIDFSGELNPTTNHVPKFGSKSSPTWAFRWDQHITAWPKHQERPWVTGTWLSYTQIQTQRNCNIINVFVLCH